MPKSIFAIATDFNQGDRASLERLLRAYESELGISLCFQDFEAEVAALPGAYGPPDGSLLLARTDTGTLVGVVGVRCLDRTGGICEMKRLYVTPEGRGQGLGGRLAEAALAEAALAEACRLGYRVMRLDTLPMMREAQGLYAALGFRDIANYNGNPVEGARFLEKDLRSR